MKNLTVAITLISLLAGALLTLWGLAHMQWPQVLPWSDKAALFRFASFLLICTILVFAGTWWSKKSALLVGTAIAAGITLLAGALWPLLVTIWFAIASSLLGMFILSALRVRSEEDRWVTYFLVGAGIYGTAVGLIAHYSINYPGVYGAALAAPLILGWRILITQANNILSRVWHRPIDFKVNRLEVAIVVVALIHCVVALMPEVGFDALWQHLFVSSHLATRHRWGFDASTYVWAVIPMMGDWIFSIGYMLAGETATRLFNVGFIFILGWLVRDLVLWAGGVVTGARFATLLLLSTPLTFTESSTLFIESIFATFVVAGSLSLFRLCFTDESKTDHLVIAALLLGYAVATKAVALMFLPTLFLVLIWKYKVWLKSNIKSALMSGFALFILIGSIPYITAWRLTGNPVFPFFNQIFQSLYWHPVNFEATAFGKGTTWDVLYQVIFHSGKYLESAAGVSGFQWLILFLPTVTLILFRKRPRELALIFVGLASVISVFHSTAYLRYIYPACIVLIAAIGVSFKFCADKNTYLDNIYVYSASFVVLLNLIFLNAGAFYADFPLQSILSDTNRRDYLSQRLPIRSAVDAVNRLNTGKFPVAVFASPLTAGLFSDALYPDWTNYKFQGNIGDIKTGQDFINTLQKYGAEFVILDSNWKGVNCCSDGEAKQAIVEKMTDKIFEYGSLSVRKIRIDQDNLFKVELLNNPNFTATDGWSLSVGSKLNSVAGVLQASVSSNAAQGIAVTAGRRYLNTIVARCYQEKSLGRVQVNWHDAKGQFIIASIKTFECSTDWTEHAMEVVAPLNATRAVIYASGHTATMIEFKSVSFRQ